MKKLINGKYIEITAEEIAEAEAMRKEMEAQMPPQETTAEDVLNALLGVSRYE